MHLEDNLFELHEQLANKTYNHSNYTPFYISDPKLRHIHKACVRDRILHHAIFRILYPLFDKSFIFDSYSCRNGKGTHRAVNRLGQFLGKVSNNYTKNVYALKCDISKFFDSIDQKVLLDLILAKIKDKNAVWLMQKVIYSFEKEPSKGIPLGNVTSQLFANVYLNELDQFMKHKLKVKYYIRYCDDFIMAHGDPQYLTNLIPLIQLFLEQELALKLHSRKVILRKFSQGIDFLGYVIMPNYRILRTKTKKRIMRKLVIKINQYKEGALNKTAFLKSLQSYNGILTHCDSEKIKVKIRKIIKSNLSIKEP